MQFLSVLLYRDTHMGRFVLNAPPPFGPCLHETGTKLDRHEFVSVAVLSLVAVYMRPA